jgi:hypothetical protein
MCFASSYHVSRGNYKQLASSAKGCPNVRTVLFRISVALARYCQVLKGTIRRWFEAEELRVIG